MRAGARCWAVVPAAGVRSHEVGLRLLSQPSEPNYVHLVWVVRRVTSTQEKYIRMFYGEDALDAVTSPRRRSAEA